MSSQKISFKSSGTYQNGVDVKTTVNRREIHQILHRQNLNQNKIVNTRILSHYKRLLACWTYFVLRFVVVCGVVSRLAVVLLRRFRTAEVHLLLNRPHERPMLLRLDREDENRHVSRTVLLFLPLKPELHEFWFGGGK